MLRMCFMVVLGALAPLAWTQQTTDSDTVIVQETPEVSVNQSEKPEDKTATQAPARRFRPSEEVSEDLSVSFPADI